MQDLLTKEEAAEYKRLMAELGNLQAKARKPIKSKEEKAADKVEELSLSKSAKALAKSLSAGPVELSSAQKLADAAKLNAAGLVLLFGDDKGKLWAKPQSYWLGVAMGAL